MSQTNNDQAKQSTPLKDQVPDPEVMPRAKRRRFSAAYKRRILEEADRCTDPGEIGALLRREGLYSSHLSRWRQVRATGGLQALSPQKRGRNGDPQAAEIVQLRRENKRLQQRLEQAELIMEVQKKLSQMLGLTDQTRPEDENE
jgi:transposase-like protein